MEYCDADIPNAYCSTNHCAKQLYILLGDFVLKLEEVDAKHGETVKYKQQNANIHEEALSFQNFNHKVESDKSCNRHCDNCNNILRILQGFIIHIFVYN